MTMTTTVNLSERPSWMNPRVFLAGFSLLYLVSGLLHLGLFPLNGDEPRRAVVAIEMIESGNYIKPTTLGWDYYNKPPVYNWLISACMKLTGTTGEAAVRLPSLLALIAWGWLNFRIISRIATPVIGALSSVFLVTSFDIYFWGLNNGGEIDIFYSFLVYLQVISLYFFNQRSNWLALYLVSYSLAALGLLTKGFPSVLFQGFSLLALCLFNRSLRVLFRWQHLAGIAAFVAVAGGYFYIYNFQNNAWIYLADLLKEAFNKSGLGEYPERFVKKVAVYPFSFLKILLPWALVLAGLWFDRARAVWKQPLVRFSLLFIAFNIAPYWFTGHPRMRYVYMFVPFALLVLAYLYDYYWQQYRTVMERWLRYGFFLFAAMLPGILGLLFFYPFSMAWLALTGPLLVIYLIFYRRAITAGVWYFALGIVVVRLAYAAHFLPVKAEETTNRYPAHMEAIAGANQKGPLTIYKKADRLDLELDLKVATLHMGTIPAIPYLAYQVPYYYYRETGRVVTFDTLLQPGRTYLAFGSDIAGLPVDTLYSFQDYNQHNENITLFRLRDKGAATPEKKP